MTLADAFLYAYLGMAVLSFAIFTVLYLQGGWRAKNNYQASLVIFILTIGAPIVFAYTIYVIGRVLWYGKR
jgi:hypothetical protein